MKLTFVVFFTSLAFTSLGLLAPVFSSKSEQLHQAKAAFSHALQSSYEGLRATSYELIEDTNLKQNISWGLAHSVGGILSQYIFPGAASHIQVMDGQCNVVAAPRSSVAVDFPCQSQISQPQEASDVFFWTQSLDTPKLNLLRTFTVDNQPYYLVLSQDLNMDWVNAHPKLSKFWHSLSLTLESNPDITNGNVLAVANDHKAKIQLALTTKHTLYRIAPFLFKKDRNQLHWLFNLLTILGCLALFVGLILNKIENIRFTQKLTDFYRWSKPSNGGAGGNSYSGTLSHEQMIQAIRKWVDNNQRFYLDEAREKASRIEAMNQTIDDLEKKIVALQNELYKVEAYKSLQTQFEETGQGFLRLQRQTLDKLETINDTITHGLSGYIRNLGGIISQWRAELSQAHPRKFIRNLSERINPTTDKSQLESDLLELFNCAEQIKSITIQTAIASQSTLENLGRSIKAAEHLISINQNDSRQLPNLYQLVHEGQNLIPMTGQMHNYRCENLVDQSTMVSMQTLSPSIWSSVIYHVHMTLIHTAKAANIKRLEIQTQVKKRGQKFFLVVSNGSDLTDLPRLIFSEKAKSHLQIARQLVANAKVQIIELPTLMGLAPIAICWEEEFSTRDSSKIGTYSETSNHESSILLV